MRELLRSGMERLDRAGVEEARLDAELLLAATLGVPRLSLHLMHDATPDEADRRAFALRVARRAAREPLQYILGEAAFRELTLKVRPGVLIPRPETEWLVQVVLDWAARQGREGLTALDIGTGSGAIALSLALEGPFGSVVATDVSEAALEVARGNALAAGMELAGRVDFRAGPALEPVGRGERFDVVVSNPPYVRVSDRDSLEPEIREWEPAEALFAGQDGLEVLRVLAAGAPRVLRPGGLLVLEVGVGQAADVAAMLADAPGMVEPAVARDLAGRERIVTARHAN